jgi:hypothetical protein
MYLPYNQPSAESDVRPETKREGGCDNVLLDEGCGADRSVWSNGGIMIRREKVRKVRQKRVHLARISHKVTWD